ncbi:DNA-binding transcription repressor [Mortierella sp. AD011]|nr:DNA-binding transcription repressor [Mortierella sp. AD011]
MTSSVSARQSSIPGNHSGPSKRMRFSLSSLQSPSSNGTAHLTQRDIEALQRKGLLLPTVASTSQSTSNNSKSQASSSTHTSASDSSRSDTPPPKTPTTADQILCTKPPLPIAARVAPLTAPLKSKHTKTSSKHKGAKGDENLIIHYKERQLPAYHHGVIEDTCSHLHSGTNIRRHSDSSSSLVLTSPAIRNPIPEDTMALDSFRRASIATASPVIPSPLGGRTILYKASYAHTLLSLPSKTVYTGVDQDGEHFNGAGPTPEMTNFKFPAEENRSKTPTSPAMPPSTAAMSPTIRSKRKSSIPMRSPTWNNTQDTSPGVVFRLPFGTPPLPSAPFRKATTPSAHPSSSPMNSLEEESNTGGSTPPTSYPSPASSSRAASASGPSNSEAQESQSIRFETPPSPANRSGLGIQVQESFSEPDATHPLESSALISAAIASTQSQPITFREEDSSISIGDIIVAEQASAAQRQATRSASQFGAAEDSSMELGSMPTPPLTSRVLSMRVMETSSERQYSPRVGQSEGNNLTSPPTPFTPGPGFSSSQAGHKSHDSSNSLSQNPLEILRMRLESQESAQENKSIDNAMDLDHDQGQDRGSRAGSSSPVKDVEHDKDDEDEDPSILPLWAQRQNHIRRQSLIPRLELDFVKGSGILPPANRGLITPGGAKILSYPVLISDMVHVALDELQAKGVTLDGSDISEESEEDAEHNIHHSSAKGTAKINQRAFRNANNAKATHSKRKKGGASTGKRRGSTVGTKSHAHSQGDEEYQSGEEYAEDLEGANEHNERQGYMTSQFNKRRRVSSVKQNGLDAETSDRHGHRVRGTNSTDNAVSPSTSPHMGTSSSFRSGNGLGSPVVLGRSYVYENDMEDEEDIRMGMDEAEGVVDIEDDEDVNSHYRRHSEHHQHQNHKSQHKDARRSHVPEHLRIPASELDIAVQLTREMIESSKKRPHKKEKSKAHNHQHNSRPSLKTLKPLLEATMKVDGRRHGTNDDDDNDNDTNGDERDLDEKEMGKAVGNVQSSSSTKKAAKMALDQSGSTPKKAPKPKEGKMTTKRCEACGASETPCWRPGYTAHSALCNSCGLRYKKSNVFCAKVGCKYIPLKTEYAAMEADRLKAGRAHLLCHKCKGPVALPIPKE